MKKIIGTTFFMVIAFLAYSQEGKVIEISGPAISFEENTHDFGDIVQGEKVEHTFSFENSGNAPLIITDVRVTCGCTATDWPRDPIAPGVKSKITVEFNSAGKKGIQKKVVTIVSNAVSPLNQITITTNVVVKNSDTE